MSKDKKLNQDDFHPLDYTYYSIKDGCIQKLDKAPRIEYYVNLNHVDKMGILNYDKNKSAPMVRRLLSGEIRTLELKYFKWILIFISFMLFMMIMSLYMYHSNIGKIGDVIDKNIMMNALQIEELKGKINEKKKNGKIGEKEKNNIIEEYMNKKDVKNLELNI